jgi:hypothetical protein
VTWSGSVAFASTVGEATFAGVRDFTATRIRVNHSNGNRNNQGRQHPGGDPSWSSAPISDSAETAEAGTPTAQR